MTSIDVTVCIVNWNTRDLLRNCLRALDAGLGRLSVEVVVVDNGSTDGSVELVLEEFPLATLIRNERNQGFARANNQALARARGRYVLLLNSDAFVEASTLAALVEALDGEPRAGAAGGTLLNADGSFQHSYADFPGLLEETLLLTGLSRWLLRPGYPSYPESGSRRVQRVDWVSGALLMVRAAAIEQVGPLDEAYFMYAEEMDWCYRLRRARWLVVHVPGARAVHLGGGTSRRVPRPKRAQLYRSKWLFMRKHRGIVPATLFSLLVRGVSAAKLVVWALAGLSRDASRRDLARQHVASYRYLLASF